MKNKKASFNKDITMSAKESKPAKRVKSHSTPAAVEPPPQALSNSSSAKQAINRLIKTGQQALAAERALVAANLSAPEATPAPGSAALTKVSAHLQSAVKQGQQAASGLSNLVQLYNDPSLEQAITAMLDEAPSEANGLQFTLSSVKLPAATFSVVAFDLQESLSTLFELTVDLASPEANIDFNAVLDEQATLSVWRNHELVREVTGIVATFEQGDTGFERTRYRMILRPALWRTTLRHNSRIFQRESIPEIISTLMKENGRIETVFALRRARPPREFCVQYQESDFHFLQRLTAEEGIFFYFEFEQQRTTLVFTDDVAALSVGTVLPYNINKNAQANEQTIQTFRRREQVRTAKVELQDYTFKQPKWPGNFKKEAAQLHNQRVNYEHFDFPGRFKDTAHGESFTRYRLEALRNDAQQGIGESNAFALQPGFLFSLQQHPRSDLNKNWQVVTIHHQGKQPQALAEEGGGAQGTTLTNQFTFIPHNQTWRPTPLDKPKVDGPQIAMVVGPPGEEIWCDEFGRVRLQFLWDRQASGDETSSCWIRVSQPLAGKGFGMVAIPRIGQEVIVDFLHGDPDQPVVTGRTYHATNKSSLNLPAAKTQLTLRSQTHKGSGYNELRFEDADGSQELVMHAQRDMNTKVLNDKTNTILNNNTLVVLNDDTGSVKNNQTLTIEKGNRTIDVLAGDESKTIGQGSLTEEIHKTRKTTANQITVNAKADDSGPGIQDYQASNQIKLSIGKSQDISVTMTSTSITLMTKAATITMTDKGNITLEGDSIVLKAKKIDLNPD